MFTNTLTARQQDVLNLVKHGLRETGFPPTRAEIAKSLGLKSANSAEEHLRALERKGAIELIPGSSRGIRIKKTSDGNDSTVMRAKSMLGMMLPLIGRVAAGNPILATENIEAQYQVDASFFSAQPDYLLRVKGLSMKDIGIMDGDFLAVKTQSTARDGQIVVARVGDEVTVKRFKQMPGHIALLPENMDFKPIVITPDHEDFAIEGLAVGLVRGGF